ncbi:hypothetical protein ABZ547_08385 [Streptomyces sparsogenes]|uniref:hypothetical protein n=1 Tax=Streptomyces sparsogenes TaxID=67365 RepID=UPI00340AD901
MAILMADQPTPKYRVLLARLEAERAKAERNSPLCTVPEVRWVNEGMAAAHRIDAAHVLAVFEGPEATAAYLRGEAPPAGVATTATPVPDDGLREQYAAAIRALNDGGTLADLDVDDDVYRLVDAVLAVRDRRMEQLAAGRERFKRLGEEVQRDRDRLAAQVDQLIERLGQYADRAIANGERAERAAAENAALQAALAAVREYLETSGDDGVRTLETVLRILDERGAQPAEDTFVPPPPGSTAEQLPDDILALIDPPPYLSTACETAQLLEQATAEHPDRSAALGEWARRMHQRCRGNNKFTGKLCTCTHHGPG